MGGAHLVNYLLHIILLNVFLYLGVSKAWAPVPGVCDSDSCEFLICSVCL